jgi:hypothetical protein
MECRSERREALDDVIGKGPWRSDRPGDFTMVSENDAAAGFAPACSSPGRD